MHYIHPHPASSRNTNSTYTVNSILRYLFVRRRPASQIITHRRRTESGKSLTVRRRRYLGGHCDANTRRLGSRTTCRSRQAVRPHRAFVRIGDPGSCLLRHVRRRTCRLSSSRVPRRTRGFHLSVSWIHVAWPLRPRPTFLSPHLGADLIFPEETSGLSTVHPAVGATTARPMDLKDDVKTDIRPAHARRLTLWRV